jgi:LAO/AO transport system kinase
VTQVQSSGRAALRRSLRTADVGRLVDDACTGEARAVSRLLSLVEDGTPDLPKIMALLTARPGHAHVVGLTGSPGVGKSTSASNLVAACRSRGLRVGVLAVDPSSPLSGGALLGDRIRMQEHTDDDGVFMRSMASRGHLGGVSRATPQALRVLSAAGFDVVLLETVGVGQSEVAVAGLADTTLVLLAPGLGDGIQAAKAGLLEVADVFVVNKADRPGADQVVRELRNMLAMDPARRERVWRTPIVKTNAVDHEGYGELLEAIDRHSGHLRATGEGERRRIRRAEAELDAIVTSAVDRRLARLRAGEDFSRHASAVATGNCDAYSAAERLLDSLLR